MKQKLSIALVALSISAHAQITLEKSYSNNYRMEVVKIENDGFKYVGVETATKKVILYNTDHSVWKTINTNIPSGANIYNLPTYASKNLFNSDNKVEVLISYINGSTQYSDLYADDGTLIKSFSGAVWHDLKKVDNDWKLLIHNSGSQHTDVYSLPGQYVGAMIRKGGDNEATAELYPNPMDNAATINYKLPEGVKSAQIAIYNATGVLIRTYPVTDQFTQVLIERGELPAGNYVYSVIAAGYNAASQMFTIR